MTVEIQSVELHHGIVIISAVDCSEEHLQYLERNRDDGVEKEIQFSFDTRFRNQYLALRSWLRQQKAAGQSKTWGEALASVTGIVTTINGKYRVWE